MWPHPQSWLSYTIAVSEIQKEVADAPKDPRALLMQDLL